MRVLSVFCRSYRQYNNANSILRLATTRTARQQSIKLRGLYSSANNSKSAASYLLLVIPASTFCLGCWQVYRRRWKLDLIAHLEQRVNQPAIDLPEDLDEINNLEYRKVKLRGKFDHSKEMYISPRSLLKPDQKDNNSGSILSVPSNETFGVWVITPFEVKNRNLRILVNRGWVPRYKIHPKTRTKGQIEEEVELIGVVRNSEKRQAFGLKNDDHSDVWHYRDIDGLAQKLNTAPIFVDADINSTVSDGPIGGQTRVSLRNEHLSYIITWYGLSIITFYMWYMKVFKRKPII